MNESIKNQKNSIIDGQLIISILSIIAIVIGIVIILNQKQKANNEDGFLTNQESQNLALIAKVIFLFVVLYSLELNYKSYDLAEQTNQSTDTLNLQIASSYVSVIPALIGLYVVITSYNDTSFQPSEIENPYI